jgi:hypothetical protein
MVASVRDCYQEFNLLPIARLLWSIPQSTFQFTFEQHVGRSVDRPTDDKNDNTSAGRESEVNRAVVMHNVFQTLIKDDVLSLKRYAYSRHLLEKIIVLPTSRQGIIDFTNGYRQSPKLWFS